LFDYTESALHQVLPMAPLGGPATASVGSFLTQFLQHCATGQNAVTGATGTRLDLVSFHAKGGVDAAGGNAELNLGHQLTLHSNGFKAIAAFPQFKTTPIVISEADPDGCAACIETQPSYRTSPAYGAYEVVMMKRTLELEANLGVNVRGVLAWAFLFENEPLFAAYRVLATNGIDLPVLNAFRLLGALSGETIPVTSTGALPLATILAGGLRSQPDIDAMATRDGQQVKVLVWNYHDIIETVAASAVTLNIKVPASFGSLATVSHLRVDETHGDAYTVWVSQGSPATPTAAQLTALEDAMVPSLLQPDQSVAVTNGAVSVNFDLPRFGLSLVTLTAVSALDASTGAPDLSEAGAGAIDGAAPAADASLAYVDAAADSTSATTPGGSGASPSSSSGRSAPTDSAAASGSGAPSSSGDGATGASNASPHETQGTANGAGGKNAGCGCGVAPRRQPRHSLLALLALTVAAGRRFRAAKRDAARRSRAKTA